MTNIVIDTNVIVSAAISPMGNPAKIKAIIASSEDIQVFYSDTMLDEYKRVLAYERLKIAIETQNEITDMLQEIGILVEPPISTIPMPDETDRAFYDTAKASGAILITGNTRHYPDEPFIVTPADFLAIR